MRVKVHLHGYMSAFHDGPIEVVADTVAAAVTWVTRSLPGFKPNALHGRHRIRVVGCDQVEDLYRSVEEGQHIHVLPQLAGGKKGGFLQIVLGAALVAVGFFLGMPFLMKIGALIFLGGISSLLQPTPSNDTGDGGQTKSRYLGAPKNTVDIGTRIPIPYGECQIYGHYLSFDVDAQRVAD